MVVDSTMLLVLVVVYLNCHRQYRPTIILRNLILRRRRHRSHQRQRAMHRRRNPAPRNDFGDHLRDEKKKIDLLQLPM